MDKAYWKIGEQHTSKQYTRSEAKTCTAITEVLPQEANVENCTHMSHFHIGI